MINVAPFSGQQFQSRRHNFYISGYSLPLQNLVQILVFLVQMFFQKKKFQVTHFIFTVLQLASFFKKKKSCATCNMSIFFFFCVLSDIKYALREPTLQYQKQIILTSNMMVRLRNIHFQWRCILGLLGKTEMYKYLIAYCRMLVNNF